MALSSDSGSVSSLLQARFASAPGAELEALVASFLRDAFAYANETFGVADLRAAWDEFHAWLGKGIDTRSPEWNLFLAWYVFHWHSELKEGSRRPSHPSIAERYLRDRPDVISPDVHTLVRSAVGTPLDFYEVLHLPEFDRYYLKSLFLGYQQSYGFTTLPPAFRVGEVFLAKIVHLYGDQGVVAGVSQPLNPHAKVAVGYLRRNLIKTRATDFSRDFWLFDADVFNLYHDLTLPLS